jgi:SPP1 family predicted phage head-tail adaptor
LKCCDLNAGMLRTPVQFERRARVSDGAGGFTQTWQAIAGAPTRAYVKSKSGNERFASARVEALATHSVTVRYFADITEADRVVFEGRAANIRFIDDVEQRKRWLKIDVQTGAAD